MFVGVFQTSRALFLYNQLMTSVSDAAALGAKLDYDMANPDAYKTALKNMVVYGDITADVSTTVPGLTTANVDVTLSPATGVPQDVTVTITGYTIDALFTTFHLTNKPRATALYYGQISCTSC